MPTRAARRTRTRRQVALGFDALREHNPQGKPPLTDELRLAAIEAMWDQEAWRDATWLGTRVNRYPTDLFVYQELVSDLRPDLVVVVGDDPGLGGRGLFLASVCERIGTGRVVAIGEQPEDERPTHDRLTHVVGSPLDPASVARATELAGDEPRAFVLLGTPDQAATLAAFDQYAPLVPVDSYVVVENTVVNGWPAAPGYGPGPREATVKILEAHRDFVADTGPERYAVTFNRNGFLRRMPPW